MGQTTSQFPTLRAAGRVVPAILADFLEPAFGGELTVKATILDKKKLRFSAVFSAQDPNSPNQIEYVVANANGKVRTFTDIDSIVRLAQKTVPMAINVVVKVMATNTLNPTESLANPTAILQKEKAANEKALVITDRELIASQADLTAIASFQTGTPTQQAKFQDVSAEVATLTKAQQFYTAEITRLALLVTNT